MSDRREKRFQELEQKRRGASPDLVHGVLIAFGYERVRTSGSHWTYLRKAGGRPLIMPHRRPHVRTYFIDEVLETLRPLLEEGDQS